MQNANPAGSGDQKPEEEFINLFLRRPNESGTIQDYLSGVPFHQENMNYEFNEAYKMIQNNPEYYFNFGFDFNNYKSFMFKQVLMRIEKDIIKEQLDKKKK